LQHGTRRARRSYFDAHDATSALSPVPLDALTASTPFGITRLAVSGGVQLADLGADELGDTPSSPGLAGRKEMMSSSTR